MAIAEHSNSTERSSIESESKHKFPNDPSAYQPKEPHFYQMKRDRNIHGYIIDDVIRNGRLEKAQGNCWKFVKEVDGFTWWFIVQYRSNTENQLKTAYIPEFEDQDSLYQKHI